MGWTAGRVMLVNRKWSKIWFSFTSWNGGEERVHKTQRQLLLPPPPTTGTVKGKPDSMEHHHEIKVFLVHKAPHCFQGACKPLNINWRGKLLFANEIIFTVHKRAFCLVIYLEGKTRKWVEKYFNKTWRLVSEVIDPKLISHGWQVQVSEGKGERRRKWD